MNIYFKTLTTLATGATLVVISALDPTGVLSFMLEVVLGGTLFRSWTSASFSRAHEREADELGLKIAAGACYDPAQAMHLFSHMLEFEKEHTGGSERAPSLGSTHPVSSERVANAQNAMGELNSVFKHHHCAHSHAALFGAEKKMK